MRIILLGFCALLLLADEPPKADPRDGRISELQQELAEKDAELRLYQQGMFACQADQIKAAAKAQAARKEQAK